MQHVSACVLVTLLSVCVCLFVVMTSPSRPSSSPHPFSCTLLGPRGDVMRCVPVGEEKEKLTFGRALELFRDDQLFRASLSTTIASCPFDAVFFECPHITQSMLYRKPFEFVLVSAPWLSGRPVDVVSFADRFAKAGGSDTTVSFSNIGGDARLIVPRPLETDVDMYAHLAVFVRRSPSPALHSFWKAVADEALARIHRQDAGVWLSTSGMGVVFLHMRLDTSPKYYASSYRSAIS